jgi:Zn-finger nucleic acid-binding protein
MYCPACGEPLLVVEHERLELDYCGACRGVWLDASELALLYGDGPPFPEAPGAPASRRRCPQCRSRMEERRANELPALSYDRCPRGHGVWFDRGELATLLARGHPHDPGGRLAGFLRAVFPDEARR